TLTVQQRTVIRAARSKLSSFGADSGIKTSIDLATFAAVLERSGAGSDAVQAARGVQDAIKRAILAEYASSVAVQKTSAKGVAIYFPSTKADFDSDPYHTGYLKDNADHPLDFVRDTHWPDFLAGYLQ